MRQDSGGQGGNAAPTSPGYGGNPWRSGPGERAGRNITRGHSSTRPEKRKCTRLGRCGQNSLPGLPFVSRLGIPQAADFGISGSSNPRYETGNPHMFHTGARLSLESTQFRRTGSGKVCSSVDVPPARAVKKCQWSAGRSTAGCDYPQLRDCQIREATR